MSALNEEQTRHAMQATLAYFWKDRSESEVVTTEMISDVFSEKLRETVYGKSSKVQQRRPLMRRRA